jgi:hypothetical protein
MMDRAQQVFGLYSDKMDKMDILGFDFPHNSTYATHHPYELEEEGVLLVVDSDNNNYCCCYGNPPKI